VADPTPQWPKRPALFLDLDGTLLHFADEPTGVHVSERVLAVLERSARVTGGAMALVSGRALDDVDRLIAPHRFPLAALHGLIRRDGRGRVVRARVDESAFVELDRVLAELVAANPGTLLEHKGLTLAVHFRRRPDLEAELTAAVEASVAAHAPGLRMLRGNHVIEIRPPDQDKGSAIEAFMAEAPFRGRTPVFVGDDVTDEDGFRAVNALRGLSVKVGGGETAARSRLAGIDAVLDWLELLPERAPGREDDTEVDA